MPTTLSSPGGNRDAALPAGNPHGGGMSKCTLKSNEEEDDLEHTGILTSPIVCANLHIRLELVHKPWGPRGLLLRGYIRCSSYKVLIQKPPLALRWA